MNGDLSLFTYFLHSFLKADPYLRLFTHIKLSSIRLFQLFG
jgi:hypothetical protein